MILDFTDVQINVSNGGKAGRFTFYRYSKNSVNLKCSGKTLDFTDGQKM